MEGDRGLGCEAEMSRPSWVARGLSVVRVAAGTIKVPAGRVVSPDLELFLRDLDFCVLEGVAEGDHVGRAVVGDAVGYGCGCVFDGGGCGVLVYWLGGGF